MADLSIQDLVVEYSSGGYALRPINGLNLDVAAGALVILLGPSGCGKTTLLSCLGGILRPKSGAIKFGDVDVTALDGRELGTYRRDTVGIVFQAFNLVPSLTALENVMVPLRAAGWSRAASRRRAEELLKRVNLEERMKHRPGDLSGGQQQRVAVARAIALNPPLILADEPTAHLDFIQVEEVLRLIRELATGERGVVAATPDTRNLPPPVLYAPRRGGACRHRAGLPRLHRAGVPGAARRRRLARPHRAPRLRNELAPGTCVGAGLESAAFVDALLG